MSIIDKIEKKYLFGLTRLVALFFILIAALSITLGIVLYTRSFLPQSVEIDQGEISQLVKPIEPISESIGQDKDYAEYSIKGNDPLAGLKLPFAVQKHFSTPANMQVLKNWASSLSRDERVVLLSELEEVIVEAEKVKVDVADAVNRYWALKNEMISAREIRKVSLRAQNPLFLGAIGASILIIAMFSLVLVLLAIERNTRNN